MSEKYSYKIAWNIPMNCTSDSAGAPSARHRCKADSFFWKVAKKNKKSPRVRVGRITCLRKNWSPPKLGTLDCTRVFTVNSYRIICLSRRFSLTLTSDDDILCKCTHFSHTSSHDISFFWKNILLNLTKTLAWQATSSVC